MQVRQGLQQLVEQHSQAVVISQGCWAELQLVCQGVLSLWTHDCSGRGIMR